MTLKTSLIITGDSSVATKAVDDLKASIDKLGDKAKATAAPIAAVDKAQTDAAASARDAAAATSELGQAQDKAAASSAAAGKQLADIETAQKGAATGATAHAAAAAGLDGEIKAMVAQIAGGASVFQTMADRGGAFAKALAGVAQASSGAKIDIEGAGASGAKAGIDLGGLGDTVVDTATKVEGMGGKLGSAAAILGGPWGAAVGIGINALGGFVAELISTSNETEKVERTTLSLVDALTKQKIGTDAAREAIKDYNEQQENARKSTDLATQQALANAEAALKLAGATREATRAKLEDALANEAAAKRAALDQQRYGKGESATIAYQGASGRAAALEGQLARQTTEIGKLEQTARNLLIQVGTAKGEAAVDRVKGIDLKFDLQVETAKAAAASNTTLARSIDVTIAAIERRRAAAKKEEEERQRAANAKPKSVSLGNQVEANSAASILATAERYRGLSENKPGDRDQLRDLFKQGELGRVDPAITAWCAAFVNSVLAATGIKGNGSLSARSFLGYGTATDAPNKGDIVVTKRGDNAAQGHVGFYQGTDAKGRVLVLGGNTGNRVGTQAVDRGDVLGFRRAPTAAEAYKDSQKAQLDAQKAAADAAKQQARDLDQVIAKYLPATAAVKDYADELARINALAASYDGKTAASGLTPEQADAARTTLKAAHDKRLADINLTPEAKAAGDAKKSIDGVIASLTQELAVRQTLDPVQRAMAAHQDELAKLSDAERASYEGKLRVLYQQGEAYSAVEEATRAAADAQRYLKDMALDAFDSIVVGGQSAGKVIDQLAKRLASAAIEAAVMGTGPLAALLKGGTAAPVATSAAGGAAQATADLVGKSVGKSVGDRFDSLFGKGNGAKVLQNAGFGAAAAGLTGGSSIGGGVGGALGGAVASKLLSSTLGSFAGPLGSIAGGILGGVVGKLFSGSKSASASIGAENGAFVASKGTGSTGALAAQAGGVAGAVADSLQQIAEQLGGGVGSVSGISIGTKNGKWHVNTVGGKIGKKGSGDIGFGEDGEAEAAAYAMQAAIAKGAITGLSAAVQQAIRSSTDVNKSLAEALKVQELETLLGGVNGQIDKAFRDFETQAKERVRLATTYGFDVVEIEKRNGEDRVKLAEKLAASQVGSLQKLIEELTQGSLFEGNAMQRIEVLNTAITKAKTDLDAGVEGAGDTLADLYAKRLAASKDAYGSTSGYAADRTATLDAARAAVAQSNARIAAAQAGKVSDPALATTNAALATSNATLDEIADQNARVVAALELGNQFMEQFVSSRGERSFDLRELAAY